MYLTEIAFQDRDAYVWKQGPDKKWVPTQVLLRINRAATCVKWSPDGESFVLYSAHRNVTRWS